VFLFVTTGFIYQTQHLTNPAIRNYADALYFSVTALTTPGCGDITLPGTTGRLTSVVIMLLGVTLFFGLARAVLRPAKVRFQCPKCSLLTHDLDAVHCKACGELPNIPNEDDD
jgi:voltage-gated potassium channel